MHNDNEKLRNGPRNEAALGEQNLGMSPGMRLHCTGRAKPGNGPRDEAALGELNLGMGPGTRLHWERYMYREKNALAYINYTLYMS